MPKFEAYKQTARARGSLALELFMVVSRPAAPPEEMQSHLPAHLDYQGQLERDGSLVLAGPISDLDGDTIEGMGLIIYRAASFEAAKNLAEADPMHAAGARTYEIRRWLVNEGSISLSVGLSSGRVHME